MIKKLLFQLFLTTNVVTWLAMNLTAQIANVAFVSPSTSDELCLGTSRQVTLAVFPCTCTDINMTVTDVNMADMIEVQNENCNPIPPFCIFTFVISPINGAIGGNVEFVARLQAQNGTTVFDNMSSEPESNSGTGFIEFTFAMFVDDSPVADILPDVSLLCDNQVGNLTAAVTNGASVNTYMWSADTGNGSFQGDVNPGSSANAMVTDDDIYRVTISNTCGSGTAQETVHANLTPQVTVDCIPNAQATMTTVAANIINAATGVTATWYNDGMFNQASSGIDGPTTVGITIDNATFVGQMFTVTASNECGNAAISKSCLITEPLPIELLYFDGEIEEGIVYLEWATATENNNEYFTVERSYDAEDFRSIARINGSGDSNFELAYTYVDEEVSKTAAGGIVYYRLKQTDFDGQSAYLGIISIALDAPRELIFRQITQEGTQLMIQVNMPKEQQLNLEVFDLSGRLVAEKQTFSSEGRVSTSMSIAPLPTGMYVLKASTNEQRITRNFMIVQ